MRILLCLGIIVLTIILVVVNNREKFESGNSCGRVAVQSITPKSNSIENYSNGTQQVNVPVVSDDSNENISPDLDQYVRRTDVEMAAKSAALEYCPVAPDYDPSQYIRKTEIDNVVKCPKMPDLKDYVLKSTIPPVQNCPACICPKVKVAANMCKKCPPLDKSLCPRPEPCTVEQCKQIIKCEPNEKQVPPCPKCPEPQPCPTQPVKVCPAIPLQGKAKCPPPKPCPIPPPCPRVERCQPQKAPECKYYGVKNVSRPEDILKQLSDLLDSNDPEKLALLQRVRELLNSKMSAGELLESKDEQIRKLKEELRKAGLKESEIEQYIRNLNRKLRRHMRNDHHTHETQMASQMASQMSVPTTQTYDLNSTESAMNNYLNTSVNNPMDNRCPVDKSLRYGNNIIKSM